MDDFDWGLSELDTGLGAIESPDFAGSDLALPDFGNLGMASVGGILRGMGGGTAAAAGGAAAMTAGGLMTLGGRLAAMFGRSAGSFVINNVKGSMSALWPAVRKYGPGAVAAALGITVGALGELLMHAPTSAKKRRRGISARDLATTRRVGRWNQRLNRLFGRGRSRGRGHYHAPYYHRHR